MSDRPNSDPSPGPAAAPAAYGRRPWPSPWPWMALALVLLAASGAVRVVQEHRFEVAADATVAPPYPLKDLPEVLGSWQMVGDERVLDEQTLTVAGCTDYIAREYADHRTGVSVTVLVAFGPAERVFPHDPTVCFPAFGFTKHIGPRSRKVQIDGPSGHPRLIPFDALVYTKGSPGSAEFIEVYYSFRHDDQWSPSAEQTRKQFRHHPSMFKVQVERPIPSSEANMTDSPIEELVAELVAELERRLADAEVADRV